MPTVFIYDSLLNASYNAISCATLIPNRDFPVRRAFNAQTNKYTVLGLEYVPFGLAAFVNGLIIEVADSEFAALLGESYRQVRLDVSYFTGIPTAIDSDIIVFVPLAPAYPTEEYPLNKDYIDACIDGFSRYGKPYALEFLQSTSGWSPDLLEYALSRLH